MVFIFIAWLATYYAVGLFALVGVTRWRIAAPATMLALTALVATWPTVDYADSLGAVIAIFAAVLFVSRAWGGGMIRFFKNEIDRMDARIERMQPRPATSVMPMARGRS